MTTPPSLARLLVKAPLPRQFLSRPLAQQLVWVWLLGLSVMVVLTTGGWLSYHFVIQQRLNSISQLSVDSILQSVQQNIDLSLQRRDLELQRVSKLALDTSAPFDAQLKNTVILRADGQTDPRSNPLSPAGIKQAAAALAAHQGQDTGQMHISAPVQNPQTGAWAPQLSRRINDADGRFQGIVLSEWDASDIQSYLLGTLYIKGGVTLLVDLDGRILFKASEAGLGTSGAVPMASLLRQQADSDGANGPRGYLGTLDGVDNIPRLFVWRKLTHYPLYVMKGASKEGIDGLALPAKRLMFTLVLIINGLLLIATGWMHFYATQVNATLKERQESEQALRDNEQRIDFALTGSDSAEWNLHLPENRLYVSAHMSTLLGYTTETTTYEPIDWQRFVHPDDQPKLAPVFALHGSANDEALVFTLRLRAKNGAYRWMQYRGRITSRDENGKVTLVSGLARDVTEQQIAQSIVRDRTAQLDVIFNLSPDAFVSFDHHLKVKYVNPAFGRMTGWRDEAIKGMSEAQFSRQLSQLCVAKHPFRSISVMRAAVLAGHSPTSELIELNGVPQRILRISLQLSDAPTVSQILYLRDVTHETIVEAMKTEFLATAAHELRTPMASIVGFAEILCTHPLQQAEQLEFAEIIWRQSLHLAGILDELLDLSRIEAHGGKGLLLASLDLTAKVNEVVKAFPLPEGRDAPTVNLPPLTCKADRDKVRQVLNNVISNAYKFSGPGTGITITPAKPAVHPVSGRRLIGLVVQDAGIGMTPEQLARVFERFYRADKTGAIPGNGLGLSISREIMELMGGQVIIASTPQQGTTVSLMFEQFYEPPQLLPPARPSSLPTLTTMA